MKKFSDDAHLTQNDEQMIATKARRHKGFLYNKPFSVTLCLCVLVATFMGAQINIRAVRPHVFVVRSTICVVRPDVCVVHPNACAVRPGVCVVHPNACAVRPGVCVVHPNAFAVRSNVYAVRPKSKE